MGSWSTHTETSSRFGAFLRQAHIIKSDIPKPLAFRMY